MLTLFRTINSRNYHEQIFLFLFYNTTRKRYKHIEKKTWPGTCERHTNITSGTFHASVHILSNSSRDRAGHCRRRRRHLGSPRAFVRSNNENSRTNNKQKSAYCRDLPMTGETFYGNYSPVRAKKTAAIVMLSVRMANLCVRAAVQCTLRWLHCWCTPFLALCTSSERHTRRRRFLPECRQNSLMRGHSHGCFRIYSVDLLNFTSHAVHNAGTV